MCSCLASCFPRSVTRRLRREQQERERNVVFSVSLSFVLPVCLGLIPPPRPYPSCDRLQSWHCLCVCVDGGGGGSFARLSSTVPSPSPSSYSSSIPPPPPLLPILNGERRGGKGLQGWEEKRGTGKGRGGEGARDQKAQQSLIPAGGAGSRSGG